MNTDIPIPDDSQPTPPENRVDNWTLDHFVECLRRSKLVEPNQLLSLRREYRQTAGKDADPRGFIKLLVDAQLLTTWQAKKMLKGKCQGFFLGRYKLLSFLGRGAMGVVFSAEHTKMHRRVALKILLRQFVEDSQRLRMFYHESEVTAALDHPNIVRAYDVDNAGTTHYLVMEYVEGTNLFQIVEENGPLLCEKAADYIRQTAEGLAYAHERGIIHRDIKPANLMLDNHNRIKILDMGLAHFSSIPSPFDTQRHRVGTPDYMSPEQALDGVNIDGRADIYSLGCTLYFLLSGDRPFIGDTGPEVIKRHVTEEAKPLSTYRGDIPPELAELCQRMMAKRPEDRYRSAKDVANALAEWLRKHEAQPLPDLRAIVAPQEYKILVADDDELTRRMLEKSLTTRGYHVVQAQDGRQAISMLDASIHVCLFDLKMPYATGMDCLRHAQEHFPKTPVIIISGVGEIRDAVTAMREGAFDYFTKPCKVSNVMDRVEEALESREKASLSGSTTTLSAAMQKSTSALDDFLLTVHQQDDESIIYRQPED